MLSMLAGVIYPHTYRICNMSQTDNLNGYVNWWGKDNADAEFSLKPGETKDIVSGGKCLKGFYYRDNATCDYPWSECKDGNTQNCCQYAGGGIFGDDLASCPEATYVWGSTAIHEAWGSIGGLMSGIDAVNAILECEKNNGYQTPTECYCPLVGTGCSTVFNSVSCFFACAFGGQNQQEGGGYHGGAEAMVNGKEDNLPSTIKNGDWQKIISNDDKKIKLFARKRSHAKKNVKSPDETESKIASEISPADTTDVPKTKPVVQKIAGEA